MDELRKALEHIVNSGKYRISEHPALIQKLQDKHKHSIHSIPEQELFPYNCISYALEVIDSQTIINILKQDAQDGDRYKVKFGTDFVEQLISNGVLTKNNNGEVIIYFRDKRPVHIGKISGSRVTSKWGVGLLWEHDIREVPISYGVEYKRYNVPLISAVENEFQNYYLELQKK